MISSCLHTKSACCRLYFSIHTPPSHIQRHSKKPQVRIFGKKQGVEIVEPTTSSPQQEQLFVQLFRPQDLSQQNEVRLQFFQNPMNWLLVAIAGLVINVIIRGIVGIFSSKQNVSSEQQVTNEPSQVVESTQLQQIDDEKLKEVEGELAQVESQLQKRESQLMEALDVADQLEQQVLLSLQTIKEKEHQLSQSTNVPDELARAQQQIIDMESNMFQLVDMVKNDNNTIKIDLKQRKQNTKSYTDALTQVKEFLKQQDRSLIEHSSFSEQDYRQQVEQIKEDYSALLSQIRDQEDNVEQLEKQLTQQNEQNRKLQDEQERELEQILQQKEDFQRKYQEVLSKMEDQIEEVRIQARNAQDKLSVLQSVLREIAGNGNASQIDQWFKQNGFETYESDQKVHFLAFLNCYCTFVCIL
eukprot:TRINITY_DN5526_c0_g1_i13.p2 TRINITY_DN5526_c0_g1~~TRINITY_DN5526_c0_g1_i13.p2  ORF type:complete len:413 (-),score=41.95 TRINITY_DN5526_c0_g1_i13:2117-3355(-)